MAVQEDNHVSKTFYSIYDGKVVRQWFQDEAPEGFSNLTKRVTPESKKTVWYKNYTFNGIITDMYEKRNDNLEGSPFEFYLELDGENILVMRSNSGYHKSFLLAMQNLPIGEQLTFSPYNFMDKEKNKRVIGMVIKDHEGNKIEPFYTKDDPKGLPQPVKNRKGEWNWDSQEDFLAEVFEKWKLTYLKGVEDIEVKDAQVVDPREHPKTTKEAFPVPDEDDPEDIPF